jgi:hypothetical protein
MNRIFLIAIFTVGAAFSQELPRANILVNGEILPGFYKGGIRYGEAKGDSLYIRWSHTSEADTFWVYRANLSLEYITNSGIRTVWHNQPLRYERRMATHHLREFMLNSPLKFDDLEALAKNRNPSFSGKNLHEFFMR